MPLAAIYPLILPYKKDDEPVYTNWYEIMYANEC